MKKYIVLVLIVLQLGFVLHMMLVVVPDTIGSGASQLGIGFGFMAVFFTSIGTVLYAVED